MSEREGRGENYRACKQFLFMCVNLWNGMRDFKALLDGFKAIYKIKMKLLKISKIIVKILSKFEKCGEIF
jgi:hypothetical protein